MIGSDLGKGIWEMFVPHLATSSQLKAEFKVAQVLKTILVCYARREWRGRIGNKRMCYAL